MNSKHLLISISILAVILFAVLIFVGFRPAIKSGSLDFVKLPDGFNIQVYADNLGNNAVSSPGPNPGPRMMLLKENVLYASILAQNRIVALPDKNNDGKADEQITFLSNLNKPHGIEYFDGWFYVAEEHRIIRIKDTDNDLRADLDTLEVLTDLPVGGHFTRTIKIHNGSLYISIGSSCNACYEKDNRSAAITKCDLNGKNCSLFATGLRNSVGFVFHPVSGKMYATENGRDWLGDDAPPDEINLIEEGNNYGWPLCYGKNIHDIDFDKSLYKRNPCDFRSPSLIDLQAHSAPLGLAFYNGSNFPEGYKGDLFAAYHGSWNRGQPTGYKIVSIDLETMEVKDFATGWLDGINVLGRPVDIIIAGDGSLLVSDDNAGKIYRIYYEK